MSWVKMTMKFPGKCTICGQTVKVGDTGFWARGTGVKHESCAESAQELECAVCGSPAGCPKCEFADSCNPNLVSQACICPKCAEQPDALLPYLQRTAKRYPALNLKI